MQKTTHSCCLKTQPSPSVQSQTSCCKNNNTSYAFEVHTGEHRINKRWVHLEAIIRARSCHFQIQIIYYIICTVHKNLQQVQEPLCRLHAIKNFANATQVVSMQCRVRYIFVVYVKNKEVRTLLFYRKNINNFT